MRRITCLLVLILAMAIPSFSFGAEPQEKQGTVLTKKQMLQSIQQFKDQKKKELGQFKHQLIESRKKELQEFEEKLKAAIPQDQEKIRKQLEQKKAALRGTNKRRNWKKRKTS